MSVKQETLEKVKNENIEYYDINYMRNIIESAINDFINDPKNNIDDLRNQTQNVFNACLRYVARSTVRPIIDSTSVCNIYDMDIIENILNIYIDICSLYNKEININGFCNITSMSNSTLTEWLSNNNYTRANDPQLSDRRRQVVKRLVSEREDSLSNMLTSGRNPVGTLAILNHSYHWQSDTNIYEERQRALSLQELPQLQIVQK